MRWGWPLLAVVGLAIAAVCADEPQTLPPLSCSSGSPESSSCTPNKRDLKQAKSAFSKGLKLQRRKRLDAALDQFETAARLVPQNIDYVTAHELIRQQMVFERLERGNTELLRGRQVEALAEFRGALHLDPQNEFAQQRLRDAVGDRVSRLPAPPQVIEDAGAVQVTPNPVRAEFHYRGDGRTLLTQVAAAYGVTVVIDESVASRPARFDIDSVDFYTAMRAACDVTKTFWTPLADKQVLLASESPENHRRFDRMGLRTFYIPGATSPQTVNEVVNLLRAVFEIRFITPRPTAGTLAVRAPQRILDAATRFMETLGDSRPEVMLDVRVYQISHRLTRNMGLHIPNQFQMFNIPLGALAGLGGQSIEDLINQLISGGGINQANSEAISALLAQLQSQQNSLFSQPIATFGGGITLMGLSLGTASAQLSLNESWVKTLEHATLRASQGTDTTFRMGSRYPIINASFAPIFNTPQISQVIQNNSFQAAFPSFNYEDIGLSLKAKPQVSSNLDVSLQIEMQFRSLQGQSLNGVPVISNREYKGSILLKNGEPAVVAGSITRSEQPSMNGIPGLGAVPGLNRIMTTNSKEEVEDELLVVITPHVISRDTQNTAEVWLAK